MKDSRLTKLAKILVNYSCALKAGEKVLIEAKGIDITNLLKDFFWY